MRWLGISTSNTLNNQHQNPIHVPSAGGDHAIGLTLAFLDDCAAYNQPRWALHEKRAREEFMWQLHTYIEQRMNGTRVDDSHLRATIFSNPHIMRHAWIVQDHEATLPSPVAVEIVDDVTAAEHAIENEAPPTPPLPHIVYDPVAPIIDEFNHRMRESVCSASIVTMEYDAWLHDSVVTALLAHYPLEDDDDDDNDDDDISVFTSRPRLHSLSIVRATTAKVMVSAIFVHDSTHRPNINTSSPSSPQPTSGNSTTTNNDTVVAATTTLISLDFDDDNDDGTACAGDMNV